MQRGAWLAVVGWPVLGMVALAEAGVDMEGTFLVPDTGGQTLAVLAALIGGIDVVVVGPGARVSGAEQRWLLARARHYGTTILSPEGWEGACLRLPVHDGTRGGPDRGAGYPREARLSVVRRSAADGASRRFTLERDRSGRVSLLGGHTHRPAVRGLDASASVM
ncbi:hypothetical protein [Promicromonospora panici]|uniref:hypothetical protein n=1 Tax=Promicromonospora panici TaxID=2219658 RepID=UPI00101BE77D|nr:hypothetical protein [Promicromonospora panici]